MNLNYSLHKITDKNNCPFSETEYSKFKFGDNSMAAKFADELFDGFISNYGDLVLAHDEIVILPSPFHAIPTASNYLSLHFKTRMNSFLYDNNRKALSESKIYRNQTYTTDYGNLDYSERIRLIANDTYYIDRNYIGGKLCLFIDDVRITGSHEHIVKRILEQYDVRGEFIFLYYAELINKDIHPNIENYYNYFFVKDVETLSKVINDRSFVFNTRTVKYILMLDPGDFSSLTAKVPNTFFTQLFHHAVSNNYHLIEDYKVNLRFINQNLNNQNVEHYGYQFTERAT